MANTATDKWNKSNNGQFESKVIWTSGQKAESITDKWRNWAEKITLQNLEQYNVSA